MIEERTATLLYGDLFTHGGSNLSPITESDIPGPSEAFRHNWSRHTDRQFTTDVPVSVAA